MRATGQGVRIEALLVGQHGLRYTPEYLYRMMDFVADGGVWSEAALREYAGRHGLPPAPLIQLSLFPGEPGRPDPLMVHDGHHRVVATHLAGRDLLYPQEYRVTRWTYEQYLEINFACGWVTPFDPRTHVRTADFVVWKRRVLEVARADSAAAAALIRSEPSAYRETRRYAGVASLACDCCGLELGRWRESRQRRTAAGGASPA
jgi:hypothetical protein